MMNEVDDSTLKETFAADGAEELAELEFWSVGELNSIPAMPRNAVISAPGFRVRQQIYHLDYPAFTAFEIRRTEGLSLWVSLREYIVLDVEDAWQQSFQLAVHPDWVWQSSRHAITPELAHWSVERAPEIACFLEYSLTELFDFFDWIPRGLNTQSALAIEGSIEDAIYINDEKSTPLIAFGSRSTLNRAELVIRTYSTEYRRNCLWLGQSIFYGLRLSLLLTRTVWQQDEIRSLAPGDLLHLQQVQKPGGAVGLRARMISSSASAVQWTREVNFIMTEDDANIHIGNTSWEKLDTDSEFDAEDFMSGDTEFSSPQDASQPAGNPSTMSSQRLVEGVSGPEDVVLEVIAGVTQVDFNELCNIQEGSLIELQSHTLPMVKLAVRGVPILEGELVRFKDVLMVQVTRRIGHGFGNN